MSRFNVVLLTLALVLCAAYAIITLERTELLVRAVTWTGGFLVAVLGKELLDWYRRRQRVAG